MGPNGSIMSLSSPIIQWITLCIDVYNALRWSKINSYRQELTLKLHRFFTFYGGKSKVDVVTTLQSFHGSSIMVVYGS